MRGDVGSLGQGMYERVGVHRAVEVVSQGLGEEGV